MAVAAERREGNWSQAWNTVRTKDAIILSPAAAASSTVLRLVRSQFKDLINLILVRSQRVSLLALKTSKALNFTVFTMLWMHF